MNLKSLPITVLLLLCAINALTAQTIETTSFGKGILNLKAKDSSWTMKFAARIQLLGQFNWEETEDELVGSGESDFNVRRARFKFDGYAFSPKLQYKIELGLSNRDMGLASNFTNNAPRYILDAVLMWHFHKNFELWIGQTKLPGNIERVISSGNMQLVDRSLVNSRFNIDRDMGAQLRHHMRIGQKFMVKEVFAFSQGEGRNITVGNLGGYQYTGRLEFLPLGDFTNKEGYEGSDLAREKRPKLLVAATFDHNQNAVKTQSNLGNFMETDNGFYETDINTLFADLMFKYRGYSLMIEYAQREAEDPIAKNSDGSETGDVVQTGSGINIMNGYLFPSNWEIATRFTTVDIDRDITNIGWENQYTLGISKYVVGHKLKIQSDISYIEAFRNSDRIMFRLQVDLHF